jgi:hypothetical protein
MQPATQRNNGWVFFIDGNVVRGSTVANISNGKIAGILDPNGDLSIPQTETGALQLPYATVLSDSMAQGRFSGKIDLKSPTAAFSGTGMMEGMPARSYQLLFIDEPQIIAGVGATPTLDITPFAIPGSTIPETQFTFRGTRLAIPVAAATAEE